MLIFFAKRLGMSVLLLFVVTLATFLLISLSPGNAAYTILGAYATPQKVAALDAELHLNASLPVQYWSWISGAVRGNFGSSLLTGQPVMDSITQRVGPTVSLLSLTLLVTAVGGVALGIASALRGGIVARVVDTVSLIGIAVPGFIVALGLTLLLCIRWRVFPFGDYNALAQGIGPWLSTLVLPVAALAIGSVGMIAKQVRASMVDALDSDYVRTLTANGFSRRSIVYKHVLRNAAVPVLAVLGITFVGLLSGSVVIEQVFGIPGLGGLAVQSAVQKDLPTVQAVAVVFTLIVIVVNLLLDVCYVLVNPKVSAQ